MIIFHQYDLTHIICRASVILLINLELISKNSYYYNWKLAGWHEGGWRGGFELDR